MDNCIKHLTVDVFPLEGIIQLSTSNNKTVTKLFTIPSGSTTALIKIGRSAVTVYPIEQSSNIQCFRLCEGEADVFPITTLSFVSAFRLYDECVLDVWQIGSFSEIEAAPINVTAVVSYRIGEPLKPYCLPICTILNPYGWLWDNSLSLAWDNGSQILYNK